MPYVLLFAALVCWAAFALRDRPLHEYADVYFLSAAGGSAAEFILSRIMRFYEYNAPRLAAHPHDFSLMGFFVTLGIDALFVVLYVRYSRRHPIVMALVWAFMIMALEVLFLRIGAMFYPRGWHPLLSGLITVAAMLIGRWLASVRIPRWAQVDAMAFWLVFLTDIWAHGVLKLFYYTVPLRGDPWGDSRILAFLLCGFLLAPVATVVSLGPWRRPWVAVAVAAALLTGLEAAALGAGLVVYRGWNLWYAALRYLVAMALPMLYARWLKSSSRTIKTGSP